MEGVATVHNKEVIHKVTIRHQCLGPDTGLCWNKVVSGYLRNELLEAAHKSGFIEGSIRLSHTFSKILVSQFPKTGERQGFEQIDGFDIRLAIAFSFQRQHSVRTGVHGSINHLSKMYSQEWKSWIWYRVDERLY